MNADAASYLYSGTIISTLIGYLLAEKNDSVFATILWSRLYTGDHNHFDIWFEDLRRAYVKTIEEINRESL